MSDNPALFEPSSLIYLCATGIDDNNKVYFNYNATAWSWAVARAVGTFTEYSYQRADERQYCAVYGNYYDYIGCDMICWANINMNAYSESGEFFYIFGNITQLEWKNPNCFWVWFKVDPYMTYCGNINWDSSYCYVEREHIEEDWNGSRPNWRNLGVTENIAVEPEITSTVVNETLVPDTIVISSPYDQNGQLNALGAFENNVFTGLNTYVFDSAREANAYLQAIEDSSEATIENVVSIKTVPSEFSDTPSSVIDGPTPPWITYAGQIYNAKCFVSQFCVLQVDSAMTGPKEYAPEYFLWSEVPGFMQYLILGGACCGIILKPIAYGTIDSEINSMTNNGYIIGDVPEGVCVGNTFAEWKATQGNFIIANALVTGLKGVVGGVSGMNSNSNALSQPTGVLASAAGTAASSLISTGQQFATAKKYGSCLIGSTNASANIVAGINNYGYTISWIIPTRPNLYALDDYFSRFGYQVNRLKVPNVNTRPHWNYVKTGEAHIAGDIPYLYRVQIENMLNHGVTFWNEDWTIGDYSDKAGNMG